MSRVPTIRVKSQNPEHHGFVLRNVGDMRYGEELFMAEEFEHLGVSGVRLKMASLPPDDDFVVDAKEWLKLKEHELSTKVAADRIAREEETLSIAKEANSIAREQAAAAWRAARYAMYAAIVAVTAALVANKDAIFKLIFSNP